MAEFCKLSHGAEALIYEEKENGLIFKYRLPKSYRIAELDTYIIKKRTKSETRILDYLYKSKINVPQLVKPKFDIFQEFLDNEFLQKYSSTKENTFCMQKVIGNTVKEAIALNIGNDSSLKNIIESLASLIKEIHEKNIIHGDLTTNNFLMTNDAKIFSIDFGLAFKSSKTEDKAVDLYVFERALKCDYEEIDYEKIKDWFYEKYNSPEVYKKLEKVRLRGRKREENAIG